MYIIIYDKNTTEALYITNYEEITFDSEKFSENLPESQSYIIACEIPEIEPLKQKLIVVDGELTVSDTSSEYLKYQINESIRQYKEWLKESDYKAIKYAEGVLSEEEYLPVKAQREQWRAEINALEQELSEME